MKMDKIIVQIDKSCDMAQLMYKGKILRIGNVWDFHPGCSGTKFYLSNDRKDFIDLADVWDDRCSPRALAALIASKLPGDVEVVTQDWEYAD